MEDEKIEVKEIISTIKPLSLRVIKLLDKPELIECILKRETKLFEAVLKNQKERDSVYMKRVHRLNVEIKCLNKEINFKTNYDELIKEVSNQEKEILRLKKICNDHFIEF